MRLQTERRCILFPVIIVEMFLQLDWTPPVVNSTEWTRFGKRHTPVYIEPSRRTTYKKVYSARKSKKPSHEVERIVRRAPRQELEGTDLTKGTKKCLQH